MFMHVKLLNGLDAVLTYKIPESWDTQDLLGSLVCVPLRKRRETALVQQLFDELTAPVSYDIREAYGREQFPYDEHYDKIITALSNYYALDKLYFFKRIKHFLQEKQLTPLHAPLRDSKATHVTLTQEQQTIIEALTPVIKKPQWYPALLHGVTGSGKTEIYKELITCTYAQHKTTVLLLPEVSLAVQFTKLLRRQLPPEIPLYGFHSATSVKDKRTLWSQLLQQKPVVIIGVHLPLLLPLPNLGLILVDEEHDIGYQEKKYPKINTKEAALIRAQLCAIPIVLGSATPSLSSLYNTKTRGWHLFKLTKRFAGAFPQVTLVKLNKKTERRNFWISDELEAAIADRLAKQEQTIIFLNRRGYSFFIQCTKCSFIPTCTQCSVSLTLHNDHTLRCHYCSTRKPEYYSCPSCKAGPDYLIKKGIGTQQVATILAQLFPQARIARADLDITIDKKQWSATLDAFEAGDLDILVGTQTITKGYHFPRVTLVGILWADINLSFPIYNAAEATLQQLIQVAGRAGRQTAESQVIVQSMLEHPLFNYIAETRYPEFYDHEILNRQTVGYPPLIRLAELELRNANPTLVDQEADKLANQLIALILAHKLPITLLGPTQPPVHQIKNTHMRKLYLKAPTIKHILALNSAIKRELYSSFIVFTPNPLT